MPSLATQESPVLHQVERIRHDVKTRAVSVAEIESLSPGMLRIVLHGEALADFATHAPDDHVKLRVPGTDGEIVKRDYTPRRFDRAARRLTVDFALHDAGPATDWAVRARVGDRIEIGGPKMSVVIPQDFDWWLLIGDESALPAIGRRLEEMRPGTPVTTIVAVADAAEERPFETGAALDAHWVHRPLHAAEDASPVIERLRTLARRSGDGFVWIGGESSFARALRAEVIDGRGQPKAWVKARGYWRKGAAGAHDKIED